jgi:putative flippase GtrA
MLSFFNSSKIRYLIVGALCAAVHNAIMIGGEALGLHFVASTAISYIVVVVLGFLLHAKFTFSVRPAARSFVGYALGAAMNYPLWLVLMYLLNDRLSWPMTVASPVGTLVLLVWNYGVSQWTILRHAQQQEIKPK